MFHCSLCRGIKYPLQHHIQLTSVQILWDLCTAGNVGKNQGADPNWKQRMLPSWAHVHHLNQKSGSDHGHENCNVLPKRPTRRVEYWQLNCHKCDSNAVTRQASQDITATLSLAHLMMHNETITPKPARCALWMTALHSMHYIKNCWQIKFEVPKGYSAKHYTYRFFIIYSYMCLSSSSRPTAPFWTAQCRRLYRFHKVNQLIWLQSWQKYLSWTETCKIWEKSKINCRSENVKNLLACLIWYWRLVPKITRTCTW